MRPAGVHHLTRPVALGEHHMAAALRLEGVDIGIHPAGGGRAERAGGVAGRRLCRTGKVDRVIAEIIGHRLAAAEPFLDLRMRQVARHDHRAGEGEARLDRMLRQGATALVPRSEEHTSELHSLMRSSYPVLFLNKYNK